MYCGTNSLPLGDDKNTEIDSLGKKKQLHSIIFPCYLQVYVQNSWVMPVALLIKHNTLNYI